LNKIEGIFQGTNKNRFSLLKYPKMSAEYLLVCGEHDDLIITARKQTWPERIYNPITAMGFLAMFTLQLNNTKR
jgi:hypothetical protein